MRHLLIRHQVCPLHRVRAICTIARSIHRVPSAFVLTIKTTSEEITSRTFLTSDVQNLQIFSREYRRLKEIAGNVARCQKNKLMTSWRVHVTSYA